MAEKETPGTRERLIFTALTLFAEKGYASTSIADILKAAEANSGSLYHFFPTKQDLLAAVLETYRDGIVPMLLEPAWAGVEDPIERVFALLADYRQALVLSDCTYGCPIGSLALEIHEPDPNIRELLAVNFRGWTHHIAECFRQAKDRFPPGTDPEALASFVLTVMEGAVMQARTYRSLDVYDTCIASLRDYIRLLTKPIGGGQA